MSKTTNALGTAILAAVALAGCDTRAADPVTRAAIFGCIEIAEHSGYDNSTRAMALQQAGCGRFSKREIAALLPEYRAEREREVAEALARTNARKAKMRDACGERQARADYLQEYLPVDPKAREEHRTKVDAARTSAAFFCSEMTSDEINEAAAESAAKTQSGSARAGAGGPP